MPDNAGISTMDFDWLPYPQFEPALNELVLAAAQYIATAGPNIGKPVALYLVCLYVEGIADDSKERHFIDGVRWKWGKNCRIQYFEPVTHWARIPAPPIPDPVSQPITGFVRRPA